MQTRDYDDYVYISSIEGFRKVDDSGLRININEKTDGYCNLYADDISLSYLHSMNDFQINAIHYFEENHSIIFNVLLKYLATKYEHSKLKLGFKCVNFTNEHKDGLCFSVYTFVDENSNQIEIMMHKNDIVNLNS